MNNMDEEIKKSKEKKEGIIFETDVERMTTAFDLPETEEEKPMTKEEIKADLLKYYKSTNECRICNKPYGVDNEFKDITKICPVCGDKIKKDKRKKNKEMGVQYNG